MASRLGPAKPRGIGCEGAGGSVIASQSRQENFSRTCSMIFQRSGSHSSVLVTTSPSLRNRRPPHLPQEQGAGSTMRSTGRLSGRLRGPRGARVRFSLAASGAAIWTFASAIACVTSRSSMASSSCSMSCWPRSEDCPNCARRAFASISFRRSISKAPTFASLSAAILSDCSLAKSSRCARISAWALARSEGSGSEGLVTIRFNHIRWQKSPSDRGPESISHRSSSRLWTPSFLGHAPVDSGQKIRQLGYADRDDAVGHRRPQEVSPFQSLREQARTLSIVPNYLQKIAATATEDIKVARVGITLQTLLDEQREARKSAPHVGVSCRKPHAHCW